MKDVFEVVRDVPTGTGTVGLELAAVIIFAINEAGYIIAPAHAMNMRVPTYEEMIRLKKRAAELGL